MSDFPPGSSAAANAKSPAYADALLRARQIASKIKPSESGPTAPSSLTAGVKRPLDDTFARGDGPDTKKSAAVNDPFGAQLAARAQGALSGPPPGAMEGVMNDGVPGQGLPGNGAPQGPQSSEVIMVPDKMVGLIIGRGGEQITRLQAETGCKIQMAADSQGMPERQCTLTGTPQAIAEAKGNIDRIISNEGNGPPRGPNFSAPTGAGGSMFEMMVPGHKVGLIIGKAGDTIKQLQEQSGAKIVIIQDSPEAANEKPLRITGTPENVEAAKQLVIEIVNQGDERGEMGFAGRGRGRGRGRGGFDRGRGGRGGGRGGYGQPQWGDSPNGGPGGNDYGSGGQFTDYVAVPSNKCGLIIGKGGETIKSINQQTGAHCEVDRNAPPDARDKNFVIRGTPEQVERAKQMILEKIGMPGPGGGGGYGGPNSYGSGGQPTSWGGQYQQGGYQPEPSAAAPQAGQADYSQQWAEYYRSMGMVKEAEAIEMRNRGAPAQPAAAPAAAAPANGAGAPNGAAGTADYSAQWAEYYRSVGKHKEAEAIEAQIKQKAAASAPQPYPNAQYGYSYQNQGAVPGAPQPASGYAGYTGYSAYSAQPGAPE
jgi:far upstream element-binding protein